VSCQVVVVPEVITTPRVLAMLSAMSLVSMPIKLDTR
jgi:hypothetical protein